jgi:hypothetical protein
MALRRLGLNSSQVMSASTRRLRVCGLVVEAEEELVQAGRAGGQVDRIVTDRRELTCGGKPGSGAHIFAGWKVGGRLRHIEKAITRCRRPRAVAGSAL